MRSPDLGKTLLFTLALTTSACGEAKIGPTPTNTPVTIINPTREPGLGLAICRAAGAEVPLPINWFVKEFNTGTSIGACLMSPNNPVDQEKDIVTGVIVARIPVPANQTALEYARALVTSPKPGRLPIAESLTEALAGRTRVVQGKFLNSENNRLSDEWEKVVVVNSEDRLIWTLRFLEPKTNGGSNYEKEGKKIMAGLRINNLITS